MILSGKEKQATLLAVLLVFTLSVRGQTGRSYKFHLDGNLQENSVITTDQSIIIHYSISELAVSEILNDAGSFYRVSIPGHIPGSATGKPELPVFSQLVSLPEGTDYRIKISDVRSSRIRPSSKKIEGLLFPAQEGETKDPQQARREFRMDKTTYALRGIIPSDTVSIESVGRARNRKLSNLFISPVRYNPHSNLMEVITSMKIEIVFSNPISTGSKSLPDSKALFNESIDKGMLNYNPKQVVPGYSDQPVKMIILTDSTYRKLLEPFIMWKTQKGFKVNLLLMGSGYAGNDYSQIKETLTRIYETSSDSDPAPEYLLIIGDLNKIPASSTGGSSNVTDLYYGEFDGSGDYLPEMFIGRLPVADTTELKTAVSKIIQYEKFQFADSNNYYTRAMATAGYDEGYSSYMNGQLKYATTNYLTVANNINEFHFNYPQSYTSRDSIIKTINNGTSFINYTGHGDALGWMHINIKSPDVPLFTNKNMYPFIISNACRTGSYYLPTSFGTRMVLTADKGAIGFIGCSNDSYWDEDYYWAVGTGTISANPTYETSGLGALDRLFHTHGESPSDWYYTMGQINYAGNLSVSASTSSRKKYYWETYNLIGDPSVIPIIGKPGTFSFVLPDTLPNGIRSLSLTGDPFAYVAVSHFNTLWDATFTSSSGEAVLGMPGVSNDSCLVVITGQNKIPVIKTIYFADIQNEFINLSAHSINDIAGNNNQIADFGESAFLKLTVGNLGSAGAQDLYAKISSANEFITITSDSAFIGTLDAVSDTVLSEMLSFNIKNEVPDLSIATFDLMLKDQLTEKHYVVDVCLHAPDLNITNCILDDRTFGNGDNIPDPGESFSLVFKVKNQGSSNIEGLFNVSGQSDDISIIEPNLKSGVLKLGQITDIPVEVKVGETVPSGTVITVSAVLDCNPIKIYKDFSFRVGKIRESFEASSFRVFPWVNKSATPWIITPQTFYEGGLSARSGAIGHNESTTLIIRTVYSKEDSVKFHYKVSSEPNYDILSFKLNDKEVFKKSGEISWRDESVYVPAGLNKMEWSYKKDNSVSEGADGAWIDMIDFASSATVSYIERDLKVARIVTPADGSQYGQETISAKVLNLGTDTLKGFNLAYSINGHYPPVRQAFENDVVPYGDSVTVSFRSQADMSRYGPYNIKVYGVDNSDDYLYNDTLTANIENTLINETVSVYPNPFNDKLTVTINSLQPDKIRVTLSNMTGVRLYDIEKEIIPGNNSFSINDLKIAPSVYYLNISGKTINQVIPLIKL